MPVLPGYSWPNLRKKQSINCFLFFYMFQDVSRTPQTFACPKTFIKCRYLRLFCSLDFQQPPKTQVSWRIKGPRAKAEILRLTVPSTFSAGGSFLWVHSKVYNDKVWATQTSFSLVVEVHSMLWSPDGSPPWFSPPCSWPQTQLIQVDMPSSFHARCFCTKAEGV